MHVLTASAMNRVVFSLAQQRRWPSGKSVFESVDSGLIPSLGQTNWFKIGIHSFPAWRSAFKDSVTNKPASLLVSLGKALGGIPPF